MLGILAIGGAATGLLLATFVFAIVYANLPPIDALTDYRPKIPLRVWTADGILIGEFGEERREFVPLSEIPDELKKAILAAEDDSFYQHHGVDYAGLARAFRGQLRLGASRAGRQHDHDAARADLLPELRTQLRAKVV